MRREELRQKINEIENERGSPSSSYSAEKMANEQVKLFKLFIELINEFNNKTGIYNNIMTWLTAMLALLTLTLLALTLILVLKTF